MLPPNGLVVCCRKSSGGSVVRRRSQRTKTMILREVGIKTRNNHPPGCGSSKRDDGSIKSYYNNGNPIYWRTALVAALNLTHIRWHRRSSSKQTTTIKKGCSDSAYNVQQTDASGFMGLASDPCLCTGSRLLKSLSSCRGRDKRKIPKSGNSPFQMPLQHKA